MRDYCWVALAYPVSDFFGTDLQPLKGSVLGQLSRPYPLSVIVSGDFVIPELLPMLKIQAVTNYCD